MAGSQRDSPIQEGIKVPIITLTADPVSFGKIEDGSADQEAHTDIRSWLGVASVRPLASAIFNSLVLLPLAGRWWRRANGKGIALYSNGTNPSLLGVKGIDCGCQQKA